ncbi:hypothetical protein D3C87_1334340 [compost metagenome]
MHLDALARGDPARLVRRQACLRDPDTGVDVAPGQGVSGAVQHRLGLFDVTGDIGQVMLDRLEAADRLAELFALGHVVHRQVEHALRQPQQLPGHRQRATVEQALL